MAPTLAISGRGSVNAGSVYTLTLSRTDPGADTLSSWLINWGDGTTTPLDGTATSTTHTYSGNDATYTISGSATDEDGTYSSNSFSIIVVGAAPLAVTSGPYSVLEGGTVTLDGSASVGDSLTYLWDLNGNGIFGETGAAGTRGDETVATPLFYANGLDGPGSIQCQPTRALPTVRRPTASRQSTFSMACRR